MARLRTNNVFGTITNNPLLIGGTTLSGAGLANLVAVTGSDVAAITLDPNRVNGAPEIVYVTAHTAGNTSATILRGQEGTAARQHPNGTFWVHAPTALDDDRVWSPPRAGASRNSVQSITNGAWNLITFNVEDHDTDGMFTTGSGNRFTCVTPGRYEVIFTASFVANNTGTRGWLIAKGVVAGAGVLGMNLVPAVQTFGSASTVQTEVVLAAGETVSCQMFQSSGAALNAQANVGNEPHKATIRWVAES